VPCHGQQEHSAASGLTQTQEASLMAIDGVEGVGVSQDAVGNDAIVVYARDHGVATRVPQEIDGLPVRVVVTGRIEAR
jgi:hypothetical protein